MMNFDEFINIANASFGNISSSIASTGGYPEPLKNAAQSEPPVGCSGGICSDQKAPSGGYPEPLKNAAQSEPPVGCDVSEFQKDQYKKLEAGYREWNSKINVISRMDIDSLYDHHVLHSLAIAEYLKEERSETYSLMQTSSLKVLDLGSGGGFPGIPLAILFPSAHFTLCDSIGKKTLVAKEIAKLAGLANVDVVNARAETLKGPFDIIVTRAVAPLCDMWPWVKGKYSKSLLCLKGGAIEDEISDLISRYHIPKQLINIWPISIWLKDEYYDGKYVVEIGRQD
ncbi:MAG: 16S rRNA (guanine(527)-N(7))-methyltransferase RsmG [Bacteroidales bacterium]|jgi:16S rRNA (guanine527-N7)-methyltransferase|nr:16S rRNA (guanine(527)-N(7))-methyltransferase RsmG [Bacteroidales bacterium]MCI2134007.1 16S rRNA (guanine(527)-N(7))-methyltransferase RsmG [Bacteroidales bacterium]